MNENEKNYENESPVEEIPVEAPAEEAPVETAPVAEAPVGRKEAKRAHKEDVRKAKREVARHNPANPFMPTFRWDGSKNHMMLKRIVALVLAVVLTAGVAVACMLNFGSIRSCVSSLFGGGEDIYSGSCGSEETGDALKWTLDPASGVLTISGSGEMKNYASFDAAPWAVHAVKIKAVSIENEVEWVCLAALTGCTELENFRVGSENAYYAVSESALYDSAYTTLLLYPAAAKSSTVTVKEGAKYVADGAFVPNASVRTVNVPSSLLSLGKQDLTGFTALTQINYAGSEAQWSTVAAGVTLGKNVTVKTEDNAPETETGLVADHYYEFIATSGSVTRGPSAPILMDGSTVFLDAGNSNSYIEVTVPCTKPGIYALTMKEYHGQGQLDYVTVVNRSVSYWNSITSGMRFTELSTSIPNASTLRPENYIIPVEVEGGDYATYYAYTYMQAGINRIRIALKGGSGIKYDMGVSSFRFDLVSADTESTETVFATDPVVVDYFTPGENVGRNSGGTGSFYRSSGSFDVAVNIKKEATYDVYLMMAGTLGSLTITMYGETDPLLNRRVASSAIGSTSLALTKVGSIDLAAGEQTLTFTMKGNPMVMNFGLVRFVPQGEDPLAEQVVTGIPEQNIGEGETDLMGVFTPSGTSRYEDGAYRVAAGKSNALTATVTVPEAGVYAIRLHSEASGVYYLSNVGTSKLSLFTTQNKDCSFGWEYAADGYGNYTVYQYLRAGENTLRFYSESTVTVDAMKLVKLTDAEPTLILLSTNVSGVKATVSKEHYFVKIRNKDTLTYNFKVTEAGSYLLSGLVGGNASRLEIRDASGNAVKTVEVNPGKIQDPAVGLLGQTDSVIYAELATVTLGVGEYTAVATGATSSDSLYSQLYLTNAAATESGLIWANMDFTGEIIPEPVYTDPLTVVDLSRAEVKASAKSGIALNGNLLIYGGSNNGVYFNVTATTTGFYKLEFAMLCRGMDKAYGKLYNPAVTGALVSVNRDAGLGKTRNDDGYSKYGYYVYLTEGENKLYFEHSGSTSGYMDVLAARIVTIASNPYSAFLAPINGKSQGVFTENNAVLQLRPAGYEGLAANQCAVYEFTPTVDATYSMEMLASGSAKILLRAYEGTGDAKTDISHTFTIGNKKYQQKDENGLAFKPENFQKSATFPIDGSNGTTARTSSIGSIALKAGKTYTFVVECLNGYFNAGAFILYSFADKDPSVMHTFGTRALETCKDSNLLSVNLSGVPSDVYEGENEDKLVGKLKIDASEIITLDTPIRLSPKTTLTVNVPKTGIYKLTVNGFVDKDTLLSVAANGTSSHSVITPVVLEEGVTADHTNSAHRSYCDVYIYLTAGENKVTVTAEKMRLYAMLVEGVEEVDSVITHRNFIGTSIYPDNGRYADGYYVLRQGDSVGIADAYVSVDGGVWISAMLGGEGYLRYSFENIKTGECIEEIYSTAASLEGQSLAALSTGYARLGYISLPAGKYTVTVTLLHGEYVVLTSSFLAADTHAHIYDKHFTKEATCAVDGVSYDYCFCGVIDEDTRSVISATGAHDYQLVVGKEATCVEDGCYVKVCSVCGGVHESFKEIIPSNPDDHVLGEWMVVEPTPEADGSAVRSCINCDYTETKELALMIRGETFYVGSEYVTVSADKKTLTVTVNAAVSGFYHLTLETLLTPSKGKEAYINATSSALSGYTSRSKSYLNESGTSHEFHTGLSVYLKAGENTVTLTTEGKFEDDVKKLGFIFADSAIDAAAVGPATTFSQNYSNNTQATYSLNLTDSGFYKVGYLYSVSGNAVVEITITDKSGNVVTTYELDLQKGMAGLTQGVAAATGSTGASQYVAGGYMHLDEGEYTVTVKQLKRDSYFAFAGMTFICADAVPSTDIEDGSGL